MEHFHLTTPQQNIWNLQKYYHDTAISNLCGAIFYRENRDSNLLKQAIRLFIGSQSGIRLQFHEKEEAFQQVCPEVTEDIPVLSFPSMEAFDGYAERFAREPLGLVDRAMYRFAVFQIGEESGILVVLSHLVSDAWTFGIMANQVDEGYHRLEAGEEASLIQADYRDFIQAEKLYFTSERCQKDRAYWEQKYMARPEESPVKPYSAYHASIEARRITKVLSPSLEQKILAFSRESSITPAVLFETAVILYLSQINPENQAITIGVPILNRSGGKEKRIAGMFVSTMPLTVQMEREMSVLELAKQITRGHMDIFRHQKYPYAHILAMLREKQNFSGNLYDVMVSYQNARTETGADTKWYSNGYSEIPLAVHIDNRDGHDSHTINVDYQTAVFGQKEAEYLINRLEYILEQIAEDGGRCIRDIGILPKPEWKKITEEFNDTAVDYPRDKCVHELFEEQAERTPDRVALVFEDKSFTYRQLDQMSNSLAHFLRQKGIDRGDIIPIIAKRSWHVVVAMLGVLKAGGAYMPVDSDYPMDRIQYMLEVAKSKLVLQYGCCKWEEAETVCLNLDNFDFTCLNSTISNFMKGTALTEVKKTNKPEDPCYVIFTSGSTGIPKAVTICHKNVSNYCNNNSNNVCFHIIEKEYQNIISVTNFIFDIFVTETILSLVNGLTVYFANDDETMRQSALARLVCRNGIEVLQTTPTRMRGYLLNKENRRYLACFKAIILGGEAFPPDLYRELRQHTDAHIFNIYGPAETTVWSTKAEIVDDHITIGTPIANTQIYILDSTLKQVPIGIAGELCIAGDGVGLGYLNRPELTAERFVPNPFATAQNGHGRTMYRTGDLARWRADGEIEFLGRIDTQVKIRGLRIELGEIESVMTDFPGIQLVAAADKKDENGRQYLVGYYTSETELDQKDLRRHLSAKLPKYMVPNYFLRLSAMPMTPSGKTDRKNLPAPDFAIGGETYAPPETETEEKLAEIWKGLLKLPKVGRTDDFFELGGDSLLAISMLSEITDVFRIEISVRDVMENPTLELLSKCIEQSLCPVVRIEPCHEERYPLLPQQKAIYAAYGKDPEALTYNMPARVALPEKIDREKLKRSICQVMESHRILKSYIKVEGEEIYGIYDGRAKLCFEEYGKGEETAFFRPFHLEKAPLVHIGFTEDSLLFDMHHIIADGDSLNIILRDIISAYEGRSLRTEGAEYSDYAKYFYRLDMTEHRAFYREMLSCDFEKVELPGARLPGQGGGTHSYLISEELFSKARDLGRKNGLTDTAVFLGAYGILLSRYTGRRDVLSGVILRNRTHTEMQSMVGMFVNTLPILFTVKGTVKEYFGEIKQALMKLFHYQELPFREIADAVGMEDRTAVNTSFVYQADGEMQLVLDGESLALEPLDTHTAKFDFSMEITPLEKGGRMRLEYDCGKYDQGLVDELAAAYIRILGQLEKEDVRDISVLSEVEYHKIIEEFNHTAVDYFREKCVHELFGEQAARTPDRVALVFEEKEFTYRQLDEMSDSLAHFLRKKGIERGDIVPIIARRSWHIVAAMLGVLKAGGAYMPVAPDYPADRIRYMLETAGSRVVLRYGCKGWDAADADRDGNADISGYSGQATEKSINEGTKKTAKIIEAEELAESANAVYVDLEDFAFGEGADTRAVENESQPEDPCYVIFTSGSTGMPKGVTISHRNVSNYCNSNSNSNNVCLRIVKNEYRSIVSVTNFIFDIFVTETLLPLVNGLTIYFANEEEALRQGALARLVRRNGIEVIQTTPTRMRSFLSDRGDRGYLACFKAIVLGGEAFPPDLYGELRQYTDAHIFNIYGPAETTVWSTNAEVTGAAVTIGKPIANTQIYILDGDLRPVPVGVPGELCIAGEGVGLGYLNRPELTAERFVPNPFATAENRHGETMYRTGDLARWRVDGEIEYLGRMDTQVKVRGLRIELGEIESAMAAFPGIALCAVSDKRDETGRQYLVGYYTMADTVDTEDRNGEDGGKAYGSVANGKTDSDGLDERALRTYLSARLPKYMVPNYFVSLPAMPMTPSGKTDRKNLPLPDFTVREETCDAPETEVERKLAVLWMELLKLPKVGRKDDFFEAGGDSLLSILLLNEISAAFSVDISIKEMMEQPTLQQMASCIEGYRGQPGTERDRIEPLHKDRFPLLPQQKAIYAAYQKDPESLLYNMPAKLVLPQKVDRERLKQAIRLVMERRRILKIRMVREGDEICGIYDRSAEIAFEENSAVFPRPFDLGKAPLLRVGFTGNALLFDIHHIIADGETVNLILRDVARAYAGEELSEPKLWYGDYAEHYRKSDFSEHMNYYRKMLDSSPEKTLFPQRKTGRTGGEAKCYCLTETIFSAAREYAGKNHLTDTMVFLGAYGILLSKYTAQREVTGSIVLRNRIHKELEDMAGMFANTLPVRFGVEGDTEGYFSRIKETMRNLLHYQELPFQGIADAVGMEDRTAVNTSFVYQADGEKRLVLDGESLALEPLDTHTAKFDFSMEITPLEKGGRMRLEYDCGKYDEGLVDELAAAYIRILGQLEKEDIRDISALSDEALRRVTEEFNDTTVDYPREKCIHELFGEQAARTPERTALVFEEREFTYRQLDEMSDSLAHFLREKGIERRDIVPIIARRSWHMVAAMLGVLKAGGAYMPVAPDYPADRIRYMLETAGSRVVLQYGRKGWNEADADAAGNADMPGYSGQATAQSINKEAKTTTKTIKPEKLARSANMVYVNLEDFAFGEGADTRAVENESQPEDPCYVIFTSGSTGVPKGVTISHRNVSNYCSSNSSSNVYCRIIKNEYRSIVSVTNFIFDIFVTETLLPLVNGLTIYFANEEEALRQEALARLVRRNGIEVIQTTPTRMRSFLSDKGNRGYLACFKAVVLGGEAFPPDLYEELRQYTDAHIFNIYGPAETTVWSTNAEVTDAAITIGKPIANTQIYILDGDLRPVPVGVPGELCIAGEGVGLGYLNRPELTAERFVPNPFATAENRHGKTMYRTGDLARFRSDGEIEYLGRMDTQVKIRGLRIELGEIESAMAAFPGIALCAVSDKRDETGRQYLVGYYTVAAETPSDLDEKALRSHLSAKLPKYMVPNYFMRLQAMPMTASGKTDRKNLPVPDFSQQTREYVPPVTEKEKELCRLMEELLHVEQVGVTDDFFELGGDSLTAIEFVAKAHDRGIVFALQNIFDYPAVGQLCSHMEAGDEAKIHYEPGDFDRYQGLLAVNVIDEAFIPERKSLGNVLLTGATGFLGAHVLDRLMREETGKIYCLVRNGENTGNGGKADCSERLREILRYYFGDRYEADFVAEFAAEPAEKAAFGRGIKAEWDAEPGAESKVGPKVESESMRNSARRIIPIAGDIESETLAEDMPEDVQTVIHTAASVKHYGSYEYFNRINVEGTRHMVNYAKSVGAGLIHISTLSVSGNSLADEFAVYRSEEGKFFDEASFYIGQPLDNVYIHSKFEAERAVFDAMLAGLDARIVRVGNLTNRASDYKFQPNYSQNAFLTRFKAILEFGLFPDYLMPLYSEFSPIDLTAEGVVKIAQYAGKQTVFHLNSNRPIYFDRFLEVVRELGISMEVVDGDSFIQTLRRTIRDRVTEYIFEAFQNDMDDQGRLLYDSNIHIENDFTVWFLKKLGFEWNEIDLEYIRGYVEYFRGIGYLGV